MAIVTLGELNALLEREQRLMGLDLGTKTIGLALSDLFRVVATPLQTIRRTKFTKDAKAIQDLVAEHRVGGLVLGLPVSMDGTEGPRCQSARQFADNFGELLNIPISFWDERLSTAAVERMMIREMDISRKRRAKAIDKAAAAYILQGALDAMGASFT